MLTIEEHNSIKNNASDIKKLFHTLFTQTGELVVKRISEERVSEIPKLDSNKLGQYKKYVEEFVSIFNSNLKNVNNRALITNLQTLEIVEVPFLPDPKALAMYQTKDNKIYVKKGWKNETELKHKLFHELLHVSSCYRKHPIYLSGFSQTVLPKYGHGTVLNEGATELINRRFFSKEITEKDTYIYAHERIINYMLETIVGTSKFLECYFNGDNLGLRQEIYKVYDHNKTNDLFALIDKYHLNPKDRKDIFDEIKIILHKIQLRKITNQLLEKEITEEQYDFFKLKSSLNLRDFSISRKINSNDFYFSYMASNETYLLTSEMYRIMQNSFRNNPEYVEDFKSEVDLNNREIVEVFWVLLHLKNSGVDLSTIRDITDVNSKTGDYTINYLNKEQSVKH